MKKEVKEAALMLLRNHVSNETIKINDNARQINKLSDMNPMLKRIRSQHIKILRDFEKS